MAVNDYIFGTDYWPEVYRYWPKTYLYWQAIVYGVGVERMYVVPFENRTFVVEFEDRTFVVPAEG